MKKLLFLFVALVATTALLASNIITYTATEKLPEVIGNWDSGLHTNAFNVAITSHDFSNGVGTITFAEDVTTIGKQAFYNCTGLTSVTIPNSVTTIGDMAFSGCTGLTSPLYNANCFAYMPPSYKGAYTIPDGIKQIAGSAFSSCSSLTSVTIPNSVTTIGTYAFFYCIGLADIYCYAEIPPILPGNSEFSDFEGVSQHCYVHVPVGTVRAYELAVSWSHFIHFFEMFEVPVGGADQVGVEVTNNTAVFSWPVNPTASSYTLVIKKNEEIFCTLTFNSLGQLVGMAFVPARGANNDSSAQGTAYGYSFVVNNLDVSSTYDYTFTAKDASGQTLAEHKGNFSTTGGTGLNTLPYEGKERIGSKYFHNGNLIIERNGVKYTATGQKVQ